MPLSTYGFFADLDLLRKELKAAGVAENEMLEALANRGSELTESLLGREIITRGVVTEYHTMGASNVDADLYCLRWPTIAITTVHEDDSNNFGASKYPAATLLVENTDYVVSLPKSKLTRVSGTSRSTWSTGYRAVRVVGQFGYTQATLPERFRGCAVSIAGYIWSEINRGFGTASLSDAVGNITRFGLNRHITDLGKSLMDEVRRDHGLTGEAA